MSDEYYEKWGIKSPEARQLASQQLLVNIKAALPELQALLEKVSGHWTYEDRVYRFYHQSFKVYALKDVTKNLVATFESLAPEDCSLNEWFVEIVTEGTTQQFEMRRSNDNWLHETRPIVEAFFHAKFFLEMLVRYGTELDEPPQIMPSGWAAVLYLYDLR